MAGRGQTAKEIFGLISLALIPSGVFVYLYSAQILSDMSYLPEGVVQNLLAQSQAKLGVIRMVGAVATVLGIIFLLIYVIDYVQNPENYIDNYKKSLAIFGCIAGLIWVIGFTLWGYVPATSEVAEYSVLAEQGAGSGDATAQELLTSNAGQYEISVFDRAAKGGAIALGLVWWFISVVSLKVAPEKNSTVRSDMTGNRWYCNECGSELPVDDVNKIERCPFCSERI